MRADIDARCRNERCPYIAATPDGFCCGTCANACVVGDGAYALHSEGSCKRERLTGGTGGIDWGHPAPTAPKTWGGCLGVLAIIAIVVIVLFVGAAMFGRGA